MLSLSAAALIALAGAMTSMTVGNLVFYLVLTRVNDQLPDSERFSYFGFWWQKNRRILTFHRRFYPHGRLLWVQRGCFIVACIAMALVVILDQ